MHILENRSSWVEESVTSPVVQPPQDLRTENGLARPGFNPQAETLVSWTHPAMGAIIHERGQPLIFQYQVRKDGGSWGEIATVSVNNLTNPDNFIAGRFFYMVRGLEAGTVYQMRARLLDRDTGDASIWSNIITFMTDWDDSKFQLEREADNWLEHLRRQLLELTRTPYWIAADTPYALHIVYRPDSFRGLLDAAAGGAVPLHNTGAGETVYYLPVSAVLEANDRRQGISTKFDDVDILFGPRFLNQEHNRAILEMSRNVSNRNVNINDYFIRIRIFRQSPPNLLHGNPPLSDAVDIRIDAVGVNTAVRNIRAWDTRVANQAAQIINARAADPVLRQNVINLIDRGDHQGERGEYIMLDFIAGVVAGVSAEISRLVARDIPLASNAGGIIAPQWIAVEALNAPLYIVATNATPETTVNAFRQVRGGTSPDWQILPVTEHANGFALVTQTPGVYAFSGRAVSIPGIGDVPLGNAITSLVARFGLAEVFGHGDIDLHRNATRQMAAGGIARLAGAPAAADPITWVSANMNVVLANRNAMGLVSQQEAVAMVMALYERKTNTRVNSIIIRNHRHTAGMTLDSRYAQAVRAAFEVGIITADIDFQPGDAATIGDLLGMLAALDTKVGL
jgi:hypothetical protein